jgi:mRNA interferase MazF
MVMPKSFIPDVGDIVWLEFDPQAGHEQAGHRPALVLTPEIYNGKTSRMFCCPITTKIKGYPFEVTLAGQERPCVVLADQLKSLDWRARNAVRKSKASQNEIEKVKQLVGMLLQIK